MELISLGLQRGQSSLGTRCAALSLYQGARYLLSRPGEFLVHGAGRGSVARGIEAIGELADQSLGKGVGHGEDLGEHVVEGLDVALPVLFEPRAQLSLREGKLPAEQVLDVLHRPAWVGLAQEGRDLAGVVVPAPLLPTKLLLVVDNGGIHEVDRDQDMAL